MNHKDISNNSASHDVHSKDQENNSTNTSHVKQENVISYKDTIFQPKTTIDIKMDIAKRFNKDFCADIYSKQTKHRLHQCRQTFQLIDGPPYANGHIHMGHVLNKIQKAVINQQQYMLGKRVVFRPSFDCHGLPIEKKVESNIKEAKLFDIKSNPVKMRQACRDFAEQWISVQSAEFAQLGVFGDWNNHFTTISGALDILHVFYTAAKNNYIYTALKPVMWSITEKTSMATAEIEYKVHESRSLDIGFNVTKSSVLPIGTRVVIWTTTAWTIPANRAIAYHDDVEYVLFKLTNDPDNALHLCVAEKLLDVFLARSKIEKDSIIIEKHLKGKQLHGTICSHPFAHLDQGYTFHVPLVPAAYVSDTDGTGFVHTAPAHGEDDFQTGKRYNLDVVDVLTDDGFFQNAPHFNGLSMKDGAKKVIEELQSLKHTLFASEVITHSYPYSWRSHTPLVYRPTKQWYLNIDMIRQTVLSLSDRIVWHPESAKNRFISMFQDRPDWCISRQRVHGVPLAIFLDEHSQPVFDHSVIDRTMKYFTQHGLDSWWTASPTDILGHDTSSHKYSTYTKVLDVLDVWFDAGTHQYCLMKDKTNTDQVTYPIDLMFEGSDQHRGYFQALLVLSTLAQLHDTEKMFECLTSSDNNNECNEYDSDSTLPSTDCVTSIATHGFILDGKGRKMSKSIGNVVDPEDVLREYGLDAVRFWAATSDYYDDVVYSKQQMDRVSEMVRKIRNTLRYLDSCLHNFNPNTDALPVQEWSMLDKCIYARLCELNQSMLLQADNYSSKDFYQAIYSFCDDELSRFYLDINKDTIYCDTTHSHSRRSVLSCFSLMLDTLLRWITPAMPVTVTEFSASIKIRNDSMHVNTICNKNITHSIYPNTTCSNSSTTDLTSHESPFLRDFPSFPLANSEYLSQWKLLMKLRDLINTQIEYKRVEKVIVNSKDAYIKLVISHSMYNILTKHYSSNELKTSDDQTCNDNSSQNINKNINDTKASEVWLSELIRTLMNAASCEIRLEHSYDMNKNTDIIDIRDGTLRGSGISANISGHTSHTAKNDYSDDLSIDNLTSNLNISVMKFHGHTCLRCRRLFSQQNSSQLCSRCVESI